MLLFFGPGVTNACGGCCGAGCCGVITGVCCGVITVVICWRQLHFILLVSFFLFVRHGAKANKSNRPNIHYHHNVT